MRSIIHKKSVFEKIKRRASPNFIGRCIKAGDKMRDEKEVEFNNGFVTALALFLGHEQVDSQMKDNDATRQLRNSCVISGAKDHLIDIEIPKSLKKTKIAFEVSSLINETWRLHTTIQNISNDELDKVFEHARKIMKMIDEKVFKLKVVVNYP